MFYGLAHHVLVSQFVRMSSPMETHDFCYRSRAPYRWIGADVRARLGYPRFNNYGQFHLPHGGLVHACDDRTPLAAMVVDGLSYVVVYRWLLCAVLVPCESGSPGHHAASELASLAVTLLDVRTGVVLERNLDRVIPSNSALQQVMSCALVCGYPACFTVIPPPCKTLVRLVTVIVRW